jgi:hypothetical protein
MASRQITLEFLILQMYSPDIHLKGGGRMKASIVDLRYKMNDVLKALDRHEKVTVSYRGKVKGVLVPPEQKMTMRINEHPFFGMSRDSGKTVSEELNDLRKGRYDDI